MVTGKEMCETIVEACKKLNPDYPHTAKEIWEASPTGELAHVFFAYQYALEVLATE